MDLLITRYVKIQDQRVWLNGVVDCVSEVEPFAKWIRSVYSHYHLEYPKFFKMDNLCKLAFMSAEILLRGSDVLQKYPGEKIAIILENASSSLDYDQKHQETIRDRSHYFPSPSVFVYTIPNIMVAEVAIRHQVKGENAVFVFEQFDPGFIYDYVSELFRDQQVSCCLTGWVECYGDHYQSLLFMIEQEDKIKGFKGPQEYVIFDAANMEKLFEGKSI